MIKLWVHKYELSPLTQIGAIADTQVRHGALIKAKWPDGKEGYADLHPWPELGDHELDVHLENLARGRISDLAEQTLWLAKRDAVARHEKKNVFANLTKVKNHYLLNDFTKSSDALMKEIRSSGYDTIKVKVGRAPDEEVKYVSKLIRQNPFMVRLDFNAKLNFNQFQTFMNELSPGERARIEYIEDPIPWHPDAWEEASKFAPLAMDGEYEKVNWKEKTATPFKVIVIKPARQDLDAALKIVNQRGLKMVIGSALDHAVGVAHAAWVAGDLKKTYPNTLLQCGCLSLRSYRPNEFSAAMNMQGPFLNAVPGFGIGFDDLFAKTPWKAL